MNKNVEFHVDIIDKYKNDENQDFSIMQIQALSDGYNTHELEISNDVLLENAKTVLGKPIVAKLNKDFYGKEDFKGHETDEIVIGYVPPNAEIRFPKEENGTFFEVDAVIFKLYSGNTLDIFKRDGIKSVSCEFNYSYKEETPKIIDSFTIRGITILGSDDFGNKINPSCTGANAKIIKFSEKDAENAYKTFMNEEKNMSKIILEKLESIENQLQRKEDEMAELKDKKTLSAEDKDKETEMAKQEDEEKKPDETVEEKMQDDVDDDKDDIDDDDDKDEEKMACDNKARMEEIETKLSKTENELSKTKKIVAEQLAELTELRKYKADTEKVKKDSIVSETLSKVEKYVDKETLDKFKESAEQCKFSEITAWKNEALASIVDKVTMSVYEEDGIMDMGLPITTEVKTSIYD